MANKRYFNFDDVKPFHETGLFSRSYLEKVLLFAERLRLDVSNLYLFASPFDDAVTYPFIERCVYDCNELCERLKKTLECPF